MAESKQNESLVGVPLKDFVKEELAKQAEKNGRSLGREAARIVTQNVMRKAAI